jgi:hypothetical protein
VKISVHQAGKKRFIGVAEIAELHSVSISFHPVFSPAFFCSLNGYCDKGLTGPYCTVHFAWHHFINKTRTY